MYCILALYCYTVRVAGKMILIQGKHLSPLLVVATGLKLYIQYIVQLYSMYTPIATDSYRYDTVRVYCTYSMWYMSSKYIFEGLQSSQQMKSTEHRNLKASIL